MTELFSYLESLKFGLNPQVYYYAPRRAMVRLYIHQQIVFQPQRMFFF